MKMVTPSKWRDPTANRADSAAFVRGSACGPPGLELRWTPFAADDLAAAGHFSSR